MPGILFSKGVDQNLIQDITTIFSVPLMDESFSHLGHPLILPAKNRSEAYNFILDKFKAKLSTYKSSSL
jgi:hypothetical protein